MTRLPNRFLKLLAAAALLGAVTVSEAQAGTVFDPWNYQQNLLSAVRALDSIQNQVRQLQNEAAQLLRMDRHLLALPGSIAPDLQRTLAQLRARIAEGDALALKVRETEAAFDRLFPKMVPDALSRGDHLGAVRARWEEAHASFKRAALLQGDIAEAADADARLLDKIVARSAGAVGSLQATQAGNELIGLQVKQSLQLQTLLAAQARAETTARARDLAAEAEGRQRFEAFLGGGRAYTRSP